MIEPCYFQIGSNWNIGFGKTSAFGDAVIEAFFIFKILPTCWKLEILDHNLIQQGLYK